MNDNKPYKILVHHPNGERPIMEYQYRDMDSAEQGIGALAMVHIRSRDGIRRLFEILPCEEEAKDDTTKDNPG